MKVSNITLLGDGVYELKGFRCWKPDNKNIVKLQFGGVVRGSTSQKLVRDASWEGGMQVVNRGRKRIYRKQQQIPLLK
jgi:hypothetical protein